MLATDGSLLHETLPPAMHYQMKIWLQNYCYYNLRYIKIIYTVQRKSKCIANMISEIQLHISYYISNIWQQFIYNCQKSAE